MSFDLFSSMDFNLSKFSILKVVVWILSFILIFFLILLKKKSILLTLKKEFKYLIYGKISFFLKKYMKLSWCLVSLFKFILLSKLAGLFPYVFGWTPHILIILFFSLILWFTINLSFVFIDSISFFSHLVPQGTPLILGMFLSIIELMSNTIRPLTLSLRLGIKITTGHILLGLMAMIGVQCNFNIVLMMLGSFYFLFEMFVMFIQAMVFTLLLSQYSEETLN